MKINKLMKKLVIAGIVAAMGVTALGCSSTGTKSGSGSDAGSVSTLDKDELVIGLDDTFVPMGFKDESGELVGFDIDLAKAVGEKLNKKVKFQAIDWSRQETELNGGNID